MFGEYHPISVATIKCPVCNQELGYRCNDLKVFSAHCDECKATFSWFPGEKIPHSKLDSSYDKKCHCISCEGNNIPFRVYL
jgi:hypothetical protein